MCDMIYVDPATGKRTILGVFAAYRSKVFPFKIPHMMVYAAFTDGRGLVPIQFKFVKLDPENPGQDIDILSATTEVKFDDPLAVVDVPFGTLNLDIPSPGEYRFQIYACDQFVIERRPLIVDDSEGMQQ
jgi:hypothetical protein